MLHKCLISKFENFSPSDQILDFGRHQNLIPWVKIFKILNQAFFKPKYCTFLVFEIFDQNLAKLGQNLAQNLFKINQNGHVSHIGHEFS